MAYTVTTASIALGVIYALWLLFMVYTSARRAWKNLGPIVKVLVLPPMIIGFAIDVILNYTFCALLLGWPAGNYTLSKRLHHLQTLPGWKAMVAASVCGRLLNPFDEGHC